MNIAEDQGQREKEKAEKIIADTPLLDGIESVSVELGDDQTGDPAIWLVFHLRRDSKPDDHWLQRFNQYSGKLAIQLIHTGLTRFPYTELRPAA